MKLVTHPLKNILNRLRWDSNKQPEDYLVIYRHRGAPNDMRQIRASRIKRLGKSYFTLEGESNEEETVIPFHRVLEIRNTLDESIIWRSRKH